MAKDYNVMVDFMSRTDQDLREVLGGAIHIEKLKDIKYQMGVGVKASTPVEAYRLAVDVVKSQLNAFTVHNYSFQNVEVYGPDDEHKVFYG